MSDLSPRKQLLQRLLRRAFAENRGAEMILLIQWRSAAERHQSEPALKELAEFNAQNEGQPQAVRALNLVEQRTCSSTRITYAPVQV